MALDRDAQRVVEMSNDQRLRKLRSRAQSLLDAFVGLRLNYALLKPLLGDLEQPIPHVRADGLRSGLPALRTTLFTVCVLDAVKLAWDKDQRTPSLLNIMASLGDGTLLETLRNDTANVEVIHDGGDDEEHAEAPLWIADAERERRRKNVDESYARLQERWSQFNSLSCKDGLVSMRDKSISHLELRPVGDTYEPIDIAALGVRRRDLGTVIAAMEELVFDVTALARDADFAMYETARMFDAHGQNFWANLGLTRRHK